MCGIVGYTGAWNAAPVLLSGLSRLEYRGYDSAGIAVSDVRDGENRIEVLKAKGRLQALKEMTAIFFTCIFSFCPISSPSLLIINFPGASPQIHVGICLLLYRSEVFSSTSFRSI